MHRITYLIFMLSVTVSSIEALSCLCRIAKCESVEELKKRCDGGLTYDVCACCKTCAKVRGETCGGWFNEYGLCDQGLTCRQDPIRSSMKVGICVHAEATSGTPLPRKRTETTAPLLQTFTASFSGESADSEGSGGSSGDAVVSDTEDEDETKPFVGTTTAPSSTTTDPTVTTLTEQLVKIATLPATEVASSQTFAHSFSGEGADMEGSGESNGNMASGEMEEKDQSKSSVETTTAPSSTTTDSAADIVAFF